jgi:hypothetical protein
MNNLPERLLSKFDLSEDNHWLWNGYLDKDGYGQYWLNNKNVRAHRIVYESIVSQIPKDLVIDHLCRIRHCVNPDHLEVVTPLENMMRGQNSTSQNAKKTSCKHGHEFTAENTYTNPFTKKRKCLTCNRNNYGKPRGIRNES